MLVVMLLGLVPTLSSQLQVVPHSSALADGLPTPIPTPGDIPPTPTPGTNSDFLTPPAQATATPVVDPQLPSLVLSSSFSQTQMSVGDTVVLSITVTDEGANPAQSLLLTLPVPAGVTILSGGGWKPVALAAGGSATFTTTFQLTVAPSGNALLFSPQATAQGLTLPVYGSAGILVVNQSRPPATAQYSPGQATTLQSSDNQVTVSFPAGAYTAPLTLQHSFPSLPDPYPVNTGRHPGFGAFNLTATDSNNQQIHQFAQPLTITVSYSPEQLQALNLSAEDLTLFYYDYTAQEWEPLTTDVDQTAQTASAAVTHFSSYQLSDGSSPSSAFIPSLQGWQVNNYTGAATYAQTIDVPAGLGGLKPGLTLSYNSAATDGSSGKHVPSQAGWVGKGWSLDNGSISLNIVKSDTRNTVFGAYTLVLNGQSYDLIGECPSGYSCIQGDPTTWQWHTTNEAFLKIKVIPNGTSTDCTVLGRGGCHDGSTPYTRYKWQIWTKDGTRYDYAEDAFWGWNNCDIPGGRAYMETYKWQVSHVEDLRGNAIDYTYNRSSGWHPQVGCSGVQGTIDFNVWPATITWGGNAAQGVPARYQVVFDSVGRENDMSYDNTAQNAILGSPHETQKLLDIRVNSNSTNPYVAGSWGLASKYNFAYSYGLYADDTIIIRNPLSFNPDYKNPKLTLLSIQRVGSDNSLLPATTFTYTIGANRGQDVYPNGSWNRLTDVNNGLGGSIHFNYDNIGYVVGNRLFDNNRRVSSKVISDGQGHSYTWSYSYQHPAYNWIGTESIVPAGETANSAALYYSTVNGSTTIVHKRFTEFRGHSIVTETAPDGSKTIHYFKQGNLAGCTPTSTNDPCWPALQQQEFLKGKEYQTLKQDAVSNNLSQTAHSYRVCVSDLGPDAGASGLWHGLGMTSQDVNTSWADNGSGGRASISATTNYSYDTDANCPLASAVYGNVTRVDQLDNNGALFRRITPFYAIRDDGSYYMVDRKMSEDVFDQNANHLGLTFYLYDGNNTSLGQLGTHGDITRMMKFYDVPNAAGLDGFTIHSQDTTYTYDNYGNQISTTTYTGAGANGGAGSALYSSGWTLSSPGGTNPTPRTTTVTFDQNFPTFSTQISYPQVGTNPPLTEQAHYNYAMGTLTQVVDMSGVATNAVYDGFGRMHQILDSSNVLMTQVDYYDWWYSRDHPGQPVKYTLRQYEDGGYYRTTQKFYNGIGQLLQGKVLSARDNSGAGSQNIVTDNFYDLVHDQSGQSQARYVNESGNQFGYYTTPGDASVEKWTTTQADALGRTIRITTPDTYYTSLSYLMLAPGPATDVIDANGHKKRTQYDVFGRMKQVVEYTGQNPNWSSYSTTSYSYDSLNRLLQVTDGNNNVTSISYDTLSRKTDMTDPDMGHWHYSYDVNGNLIQQTDAKSQTITSVYDAMDRMTQQNFGGGDIANYSYDDITNGNYGKGRRTAMSRGATATSWVYDSRGRVSHASYSAAGRGPFNFFWTYDNANRITSIEYGGSPSSFEDVTYGYDAAWRPISLWSNMIDGTLGHNGPLVQNATYTALSQPSDWQFGNNLHQSWIYDPQTVRLTGMQVSNLLGYSYQYDHVGNISSITNNQSGDPLNGQVQTFGYDELDRLLSGATSGNGTGGYSESYSYDKLGNLLSKGSQSYSYNATSDCTGKHEVCSVGDSIYHYDANGNVTSGGGRSYTWNSANQPTNITYNNGASSEGYSYNADGERASKVDGSVTIAYLGPLYNVDNSTQNNRISLYMFDGKVVAQRTSNTSGSALAYLHGDQLGSIALTTGASGNVISRQAYKPFGEVRYTFNNSPTKLDYTSQRKDETGLLYYHARYYDAGLGKFVSADSAVRRPSSPQSLNRYSYVMNNPLRNTDPSGHVVACMCDDETEMIWPDAEAQAAEEAALEADDATAAAEAAGQEASTAEQETQAADEQRAEEDASASEPSGKSYYSENGKPRAGDIDPVTNLPKTPSRLSRWGKWTDEEKNSYQNWQRAANYQEYTTGAPKGSVFKLNGVKFDGVNAAGTRLFDAKMGYGGFVKNGKLTNFIADKFLAQAQGQLDAVAATGLKDLTIEWDFSNYQAYLATKTLFEEAGGDFLLIDVEYVPAPTWVFTDVPQ